MEEKSSNTENGWVYALGKLLVILLILFFIVLWILTFFQYFFPSPLGDHYWFVHIYMLVPIILLVWYYKKRFKE